MTGRPHKDLTGQRFGRLVAVYRIANTPRKAQWWCRCDCGGSKAIAVTALMLSRSQSCGCLIREMLSARRRTHGACGKNYKTAIPEYALWNHMKQRCYNPNNHSFPHYGGRGIYVCDRWRHDFAAFLSDMGRRPHPNLTLDRIDNNGPYSPSNCRWTTYAQQLDNRRPSQMRKRVVPEDILRSLNSRT